MPFTKGNKGVNPFAKKGEGSPADKKSDKGMKEGSKSDKKADNKFDPSKFKKK